MAGVISPSPVFTGFDQNGDPIPGGLLFTYLAGTSTPAATYSDVNLTVPNTNPIVLDAAGRAVIFLTPAQGYKYVLQTAAGAIVWSVDNITAGVSGSPTIDISGVAGEALGAGKVVYLSDGQGGNTAGRWYLTQTANAYSSTLPVVGMTIASIGGGGAGIIRTQGIVTGLTGLVVGGTYTAGDAGVLATGGARIIGQAETTTSLVLEVRDKHETTLIVSTTGSIATLPIPPGLGDLTVFMNNASLATIQGIAAGRDGQFVTVYAYGSEVQLANQSGSAGSAAQRLTNFASSAPTSIVTRGCATYVYDAVGSGFWRMVAHEQGAWLTPTYSAADYTAAAGTWTVDAGDLSFYQYRLSGRTLTVTFYLASTTISVATASVNVKIPGGFSYSGTNYSMHPGAIIDGGTTKVAEAFASAGTPTLLTIRNLDATNITTVAANSVTVKFANVTVPVT